MDLARVTTPLQVILRIAFAVVVLAAATVDVWIVRRTSFVGMADLSLATLVIALTAAFGIAWAAWPQIALPIAVVGAVSALAETAEPAMRGRAVGIAMFTQLAVMPVLLAAVLTRPTRWRWLVAALVVIAAESVALRTRETPQRTIVAMTMLVLLGAAGAAVVYVRLRDSERRASIERARQNERIDLARELHDIVGHHVTGIVVLAQASRFTGGAAPGSPAEHALADIEAAGIETLTSIRRLVGLLRTDPSTSAGPQLADIERIVEGLRVTHPAADLVVDDRIRTAWVPPDLAVTIQRLLQEAATNVRRHGDPTEPVTLTIAAPGDDVELRVENTALRASSDTGYGLVGMRERVEAYGGTFHAGADRGVWQVAITLPNLQPVR
ncbi:MAG: histidine kinase [Ilumatobacteraceae bacterium]